MLTHIAKRQHVLTQPCRNSGEDRSCQISGKIDRGKIHESTKLMENLHNDIIALHNELSLFDTISFASKPKLIPSRASWRCLPALSWSFLAWPWLSQAQLQPYTHSDLYQSLIKWRKT
jgi:hypothetical protein